MTSPRVGATIAYGSAADHLADVHLPAAPASGLLLVVIHGGDWQQTATREYLAPMVAGLVEAGHAVASLEYRRIGEGGSGGWPMTFDDIADALVEVPPLVDALAAEAGISLRATIVVGHSAGGQLALWLAAQPVLTTPALIGVVALGPTADLALGHELGVGDGAVAVLLGGTPDEVPDVLAQADPAALTPRVPVRLLHVDQDPIVPVALARSYAQRVSGDVRYVELPGDSHFSFTTPGEMDWAQTLAAVAELGALAADA
jgi:acetyl esterase/lipase